MLCLFFKRSLMLWLLLFQVFFVIRLHSTQAAAALPPIQEPDHFISCDLMDGRDAFLTMARERHYEFSSLRRAKYSSMALLYELHNQGKDNFVYTCNNCKAHVETRYHCSICDVSISLNYKLTLKRESISLFWWLTVDVIFVIPSWVTWDYNWNPTPTWPTVL